MGPEGSRCTPLRALWEWYFIVQWTSLIKIQDVNTLYLGSHPPSWMISKWPPWKKTKCLCSVIPASYHLLCLLLWADQLYLRSSTPFMIYIAKHKVLTFFIQYGGQFEIQISDIFVNLNKVSMIVFYTIYICYKFQSDIFGHIFTVSIYSVMEYFIFSQSHHLDNKV